MHHDLNHYHLKVIYDGRDFEISEVFRHSNRGRNIPAATVSEMHFNGGFRIWHVHWQSFAVDFDISQFQCIRFQFSPFPR